MHPRYYLSQEIFDLEQEKIFRKLWLFAGLKAMLPRHGDSMVRRIGGVPVTVRNIDGAWQASDGARALALESIGSLLFVNLDASPLPLEDQFSTEFVKSLEDSSNAYDSEFVTTTWHCRFNWKLVYENLWDPLHVRFLHPKTLAPNVDLGIPVYEDFMRESIEALPDLSPAGLRTELRRFSRGGEMFAVLPRPRPPWHEKLERWGSGYMYCDWLAYPNLHIASGNGGLTFSFEHHTPVSPQRTDLELIWIVARRKEPLDFSHQALLSNMHGSKTIVGEDVTMLEAIQAGLHGDASLPMQGAYEGWTRLRERWYATLMEAKCEL